MPIAERIPGMEPGERNRNLLIGAVYFIAIMTRVGAPGGEDAPEWVIESGG